MRDNRACVRRGFTLVEMLVVVAIIAVLMALFGGAISAARSGAQANTTAAMIARLDQVITTQFRRYEARSVSRAIVNNLRTQGISNPSAARAWFIRRNQISADMPDRWSDVAYMASNASQFTTPAQRAYIATYNAGTSKPTDQYGGAECLFMIVMQGGFADCLDCNGLAQIKKGDKDGDGAIEFWDEWSNPIDYILWAPGFLKAGDTIPFFNNPSEQRTLDAAFPSAGSVRPGLGMRPLIYSAGPDGEYGLERKDAAATLSRSSPSVSVPGGGCGDPAETNTGTTGGPLSSSGDKRNDNVVNVELKASP